MKQNQDPGHFCPDFSPFLQPAPAKMPLQASLGLQTGTERLEQQRFENWEQLGWQVSSLSLCTFKFFETRKFVFLFSAVL